jgi:hypothetical protein
MEKLKKLKLWQILLIIITIVFAINLIKYFISPPKDNKSALNNNNSDSLNTNNSEAKKLDSTTTEWSFSDDVNKMDDSHTYYAALISSNKLDLKFPYQGENHANLNIRNEGDENIVSLSIDKGQIYVGGHIEIQVRFDKDKPEVYNCVGAKDFDPKYLFIEDAVNFVKRLKTSNSLIIEATIYENGTQQFEFNTKGFKWEH